MRNPSSASLPAMPARKAICSRAARRPLALEPLEARTLLAAVLVPDDDLSLLSTHGGACQCPVCTGIGLDEIPVIAQAATPSAATTPLTGLPALSSNPSAAKKLYLDFNGNVQASWGSVSQRRHAGLRPGRQLASFSSGELAAIREIWARVAEDYAPFNINVTTIDPGSLADGGVARRRDRRELFRLVRLVGRRRGLCRRLLQRAAQRGLRVRGRPGQRQPAIHGRSDHARSGAPVRPAAPGRLERRPGWSGIQLRHRRLGPDHGRRAITPTARPGTAAPTAAGADGDAGRPGDLGRRPTASAVADDFGSTTAAASHAGRRARTSAWPA